jgi:hypothetical protein
MKQNYKNYIYIAMGIIVLSGSCGLGYLMKENFEKRKNELKELRGYENLETINEEPPKDFKPKKESKLEVQCDSNAEAGEKSCHIY